MKLSKYSKFIMAIIGAVLTVLAQQYSDNQILQVVLPLATALGVYQVKNN